MNANDEIEGLLKPNNKHVDRFVVGNAVKLVSTIPSNHNPDNIWIILEASIRDNLVTVGLYRFENVPGLQVKISMSKLIVDDDCVKVNRKLRLEKLNNIDNE